MWAKVATIISGKLYDCHTDRFRVVLTESFVQTLHLSWPAIDRTARTTLSPASLPCELILMFPHLVAENSPKKETLSHNPPP